MYKNYEKLMGDLRWDCTALVLTNNHFRTRCTQSKERNRVQSTTTPQTPRPYISPCNLLERPLVSVCPCLRHGIQQLDRKLPLACLGFQPLMLRREGTFPKPQTLNPKARKLLQKSRVWCFGLRSAKGLINRELSYRFWVSI